MVETENKLNPPAYSGIKLNKTFETANTYFCVEINPEKLEKYKKINTQIKNSSGWQLHRLLELKDMEPPNEHKEITDNIYLFDVVNLEKFYFYIITTKEGADRYTADIYQLSKNNKYAYNTENLKGCGIYPEHADEILFTFYNINTLT